MKTKQGIIVIFSSNTDNELNCSDFYVNSNDDSSNSDSCGIIPITKTKE